MCKWPKRNRTFKKPWLKEYEWLKYYRTSTLTRHACSKEHRDAVRERERVMCMEMVSVTQRAISQNEIAVISALRVDYWLAKEEVASSKFPSLITLLKLCGIQCLENHHVGAMLLTCIMIASHKCKMILTNVRKMLLLRSYMLVMHTA